MSELTETQILWYRDQIQKFKQQLIDPYTPNDEKSDIKDRIEKFQQKLYKDEQIQQVKKEIKIEEERLKQNAKPNKPKSKAAEILKKKQQQEQKKQDLLNKYQKRIKEAEELKKKQQKEIDELKYKQQKEAYEIKKQKENEIKKQKQIENKSKIDQAIEKYRQRVKDQQEKERRVNEAQQKYDTNTKEAQEYAKYFESQTKQEQYEIVNKHKDEYMRLVFKNEDGNLFVKYYYVNEMLIERFKQELFNIYGTPAGPGQGSDQPPNDDDQQLTLISITFVSTSDMKKRRDKKNEELNKTSIVNNYNFGSGSYFNYLNKFSQIDLSQQQIGRSLQEHREISKNQCFVYAILQYVINNTITKELYDNIKLQITAATIEMQKLKEIENLPLIQISLYKKTGKRFYYQIGKLYQNQTEPLQIALFKNHYFYNPKNNTDIIAIINKTINQKYKLREDSDMLSIIKTLDDNNYFEEIKVSVNGTNVKDVKKIEQISAPQYISSYASKPVELKNTNDIIIDAICGDYEATTKADDNITNIKHEAYLLCIKDKDGEQQFQNFEQFIQFLNDKYEYQNLEEGNTIIIYFHNLSYDAHFIMQTKRDIQKVIDINGKVSQFVIYIKNGIKLIFRDSVLLFQCPLNKLPEMFKIKTNKGLHPYGYYTKSNIKKNTGSLKEVMDLKEIKQEDRNLFIKYLYQSNSILSTKHKTLKEYQEQKEDIKFDMKRYAQYYCSIDVAILDHSIKIFRKWILEAFDLDIYNFVSISSLSLEYQIKDGCFTGVSKLQGEVQKFIQQTVVGGRCMSNDNKKEIVIGRICDLDGNSLYPSAQERCYYPTGTPKVMTQQQIDFYNQTTVAVVPCIKDNFKLNLQQRRNKYKNLFLITEKENKEFKLTEEVRRIELQEGHDGQLYQNVIYIEQPITNEQYLAQHRTLFLQVQLFINKEQFTPLHFRLQSQLIDGIRDFTNDLNFKILTLSHVALQDLVQYQGVDYVILNGVYFENRNYKINETIKYMYDQRVIKRKEQNPIQIVYKMLLNVSYGKLIEKLHLIKTELCNKDEWFHKVNLHLANFIEAIELPGNKTQVKFLNQTSNQFSMPHCGALVLDYSKRIMNEVMCLAEYHNIDLYYQDTDSIIMNMHQQKQIEELYKLNYDRDLIGNNELGKFSSDFESKTGKVICSQKIIKLGKKCYLQKLIVRQPLQDIDYVLKDYKDYSEYKDGQISKLTEDEIIQYNQQEKPKPNKEDNQNEELQQISEQQTQKYLNMTDEQLNEIILRDQDKEQKDKELYIEYHFRMKGIPENSIIAEAKRRNITIEQLYELLFNDEIIVFEMLKGKAVVMKKINWCEYINLGENDKGITRSLSFQQKEIKDLIDKFKIENNIFSQQDIKDNIEKINQYIINVKTNFQPRNNQIINPELCED